MVLSVNACVQSWCYFACFSSQGCVCGEKSGCNCQGIKGQKVIEHANIHKHTYSHVHRQMTMSCHKHIAL